MGWWQVNADTLAGSRFVLSPLAETFACLKALHVRSAAHPGERVWLDTHLPGYERRLASDPVTAALVRAGFGREWIADFLTPTPRGDEDFATEVARVRGASPEAARAHLAVALRGPLPAILRERDDLPERAADLLTHVWTEAVRPDWHRRRRVLEADVVARTARLSQEGWASALGAMRPGMRWLGENRLQVNLHEYPPREISGARIVFVPVTPQRHGWVSWDEPPQRPHPDTGPRRYGVVYPCSGVLAHTRHGHTTTPASDTPDLHVASVAAAAAVSVPGSLARLLGGARARVLVLLGSPMSTSQLVAVTGQGLGSVGRHLKLLLDARLVGRRRSGRSVLYFRTAEGDVLVEAQGTQVAQVTQAAQETQVPQGTQMAQAAQGTQVTRGGGPGSAGRS
ncbi:ArsR/SmtB family transcription factor [Streptomyces tauricus]|uniref:ArsR/SmtB family transcription factor n=1 Tax=Streptomyces tauricus TaxID=68274 RepID=UPI002242E5E5|nr:helix-turn-helix domain-containing protein [Streptomyces tauricus]MCW8095130.1 helix-turn-helix domain-containing protein [Streptomyces tauricus]